MEGIISCEGCKALEYVAQRSCECPSLEIFKAKPDVALSNLISWKLALALARVLLTGWSLGSLLTQIIL